MKKDLHDEDEINVNKRSTDRVVFESTFAQRVSDTIEFLKDETKEFLEEFDPDGFDEFDFDEFSEMAFNQVDDLFDDLSKLKTKIVNSEGFPEIIRDSSKNAKMALNRDADYVRRAKRKYDRLNSNDDVLDSYKTNIRIIELCNKAISLNKRNWEAYYMKGLAYVNLEKYDEAIEEFIASLALNEDNLDLWLEIANANRLNKDYCDAIDVYNHVLEKDENSAKAFKGIALTYVDCGNYKKADEFFKKSNSIEKLDIGSEEIWNECQEKLA